MITFYCILEVVVLFFALGPSFHFLNCSVLSLVLFFFLRLSVVDVKYCTSIPFAEVVYLNAVQVNACLFHHQNLACAYYAPIHGTWTLIYIYIHIKISMRHVCVGLASLSRV